jgi:hypothetical protein
MVDFNASAPIEMSRAAALERSELLLKEMGISVNDSTFLMASRSQRVLFYQDLVDSVGKSQTVNPAALNNSGLALGGWNVMIGRLGEQVTAIVSDDALFEQVGIASMRLDPQGRVRYFRAHTDHNQTFFTGDSLTHVLSRVITVLGFDSSQYSLDQPSSITMTDVFPVMINTRNESPYTITYQRISAQHRGPVSISLTYRPHVMEMLDSDENQLLGGIQLESVYAAYHPVDSEQPRRTEFSEYGVIILIISVLLILVLVIFPAVRLIFRGQVEWRRGLLIFFFLFVGSVGYRFFLWSTPIMWSCPTWLQVLIYFFTLSVG